MPVSDKPLQHPAGHLNRPAPWKSVWLGLSAISVMLVLISALMTPVVLDTVPEDRSSTLRNYFEVDNEGNLPAWWNSFMLLSAATLLFYASALWKWAGRAGWWRWAGIGLMFAAMSLDEATRLHERLARLYRLLFGEAPLEHYTWLMLGIPVALGAVVFLVVLVRGMPSQPRNLLIAGLAVFFTGTVGVELMQVLTMDYIGGQHSWPHFALWHIEELLEKLGSALLVAAAVTAVHDGMRGPLGGTAEISPAKGQ